MQLIDGRHDTEPDSITVTRSGGGIEIDCARRTLTGSSVQPLHRTIRHLMSMGTATIVIDVRESPAVDTALVAVLVEATGRARSRRAGFFVRASPALHRLVEILRLTDVLPLI